MARAFRCDDCEEFFESATAAQLQTSPEDYEGREKFDLCDDCAEAHISDIKRSAENGHLDDYEEGP